MRHYGGIWGWRGGADVLELRRGGFPTDTDRRRETTVSEKPESLRAHVVVHGRVQGVFFRAGTRDKARRTGVGGWVRNRRDGSVEAVFEGPRKAVVEMLAWCYKGTDAALVEGVDVDYEDPTGEFTGFDVRG